MAARVWWRDRVLLGWRILTGLAALGGLAMLGLFLFGLGIEWSDVDPDSLSAEGALLVLLVFLVFIVPGWIALAAFLLSFASIRVAAGFGLVVAAIVAFWSWAYSQGPGGAELGTVIPLLVAVGYAVLSLRLLLRTGSPSPPESPAPTREPAESWTPPGPVVFPDEPPWQS